jgi:hypothetical protein
MANGFSGPFDEGLSQEGGALPAPMDPGFVAAAVYHRRDARILLECIRGSGAFPLFTKRDAEAGGKDGASAWQGGKSGDIGMPLGTLRHGVVEVGNGLQDNAELGDEGLH